ncbi:hypothetical protein DICVIV_11462 [Dictyocaulus viviparus]|uniref:Uncharacterized protein n=1 Tax=Dictyocaulus viviparus TaxID=29172 RepID=A0A0D8XFM4_DICVI|nr:hypothetical protein DICVIV_11462 [Dictyocaulus viviparus]
MRQSSFDWYFCSTCRHLDKRFVGCKGQLLNNYYASITVSQAHAIFGVVAVGKVTFYRLGLDKRNTWKDAKFSSRGIEEIAVVNLNGSCSTLVTNIDEGELVHFNQS